MISLNSINKDSLNTVNNYMDHNIIINKSMSLKKWNILENNFYNSFKYDIKNKPNDDFNGINYNIEILNTKLI